MGSGAVPSVERIDRSQWKPEEYDLLYHFVHLDRVANAVITEPGALQGWFGEALWRHYSYAPFNGRVMENYHSLAFFYGYEAPWNIYYRHPALLERLSLALEYTFGLMGENGAIPEYATFEMDTPMLAPSSFGMEYMAAALEVAGPVLPDGLRRRLVEQARKAAVFVLTSDESWEHARSFTNQFLGAMAGGARLARLTGDEELMGMVRAAGDALIGDFMSPMGFLYENNGPETFAYFFVTLHRLIPLYREWPDPRVREVLVRHCEWMQRWMLPEPDRPDIVLSGSHQTRTSGGASRLVPLGEVGMGHMHTTKDQRPRMQRGLSALLGEGSSPADVLKLFLMTAEEEAAYRREWQAAGPDSLDGLRDSGLAAGYAPVSTLALYPLYAPPAQEVAAAREALPCLDPAPRAEVLSDDRGNQYALFRQPTYHTALAFSTHASAANHGPAHLWLDGAGTLILSRNGTGPCWETVLGNPRTGGEGTGKALGLARVREGRGGHEVLVRYPEWGLGKTYVIRPEGIDVQISARQAADGRALYERVPLLLRGSDVIRLDYGTCPAAGMSDRGLGVVTRTVGIEREGRRLLTLDLGQPVSAMLLPTYEPDGSVPTELVFSPAPLFFSRTGYRLVVG